MEEKNKNEELKQQEMNEASSATRASYSTGTGLGSGDCMSQDVFNSLNDRGAISGTIYVCGCGWVVSGPGPIIIGSGCGSGCSCGCCSYDLCSCISFGSGCGCGSGSGCGSGCHCNCGCCGCGSGSGCGCGSGSGCGDSKDPVELMDRKKFVPWDGTNCWDLCEEVLRKYGITYSGSSGQIYKLTHTVNGESKNWGDNPAQNYEKGIACINKHLNAKRVIIVGVEYNTNQNPNSDGTDHFVVITGRGFDSSKNQNYYTFMDNGTSNTEYGCSNNNRLYYDPYQLKLSGSTQYNQKKYTVTHIRPNNGEYEGVGSM